MSALDYRVHTLEAAVRRLQAERDGDERIERYRDARARLDYSDCPMWVRP